jgi:hypothetical protein
MLGAAVVGHISPLRIELDGDMEDAAEPERVLDGKFDIKLAPMLQFTNHAITS